MTGNADGDGDDDGRNYILTTKGKNMRLIINMVRPTTVTNEDGIRWVVQEAVEGQTPKRTLLLCANLCTMHTALFGFGVSLRTVVGQSLQ